jgi:hypothetical protein
MDCVPQPIALSAGQASAHATEERLDALRWSSGGSGSRFLIRWAALSSG